MKAKVAMYPINYPNSSADAFGVPREGALEVYRLDKSKQYQLQKPDHNGRYWIEAMNLFLGVWEGTREGCTGYWLRWWNEDGELLLWSLEKAEREKQRADRLLQQLRTAGLEPEE